jgi:hypothetical protein
VQFSRLQKTCRLFGTSSGSSAAAAEREEASVAIMRAGRPPRRAPAPRSKPTAASILSSADGAPAGD